MTRALVLMFVAALAPSSALACGMEMEPTGLSLAALLDEVDAVETEAEEVLKTEVAAAEAEIEEAVDELQQGLVGAGAMLQALTQSLVAPAEEASPTRIVASNGSFEELSE